MLATQLEAATGTSKESTTPGLESDEPSVRDVTLEILGERRAEWREGYDAGLREGARRLLDSEALGQVASELVMMRRVAESLGKQADFWKAKFLDAVHVIGNPRKVSSPVAVAARTSAEDPSAAGLDQGIVREA